MQQAIVISSHYGADSGYPNLTSWTPSAELLAARLAQHGYHIDRLLPGVGLVQRLRECLRAENRHASVVLYFAGYSLVTENGDPALLLADESVTALRLSQLVARVARSFGRVLLLLDSSLGSGATDVRAAAAAHGVALGATAEASMVSLALGTCLPDNVEALIAVRPWDAPDKRVSPFARRIEQGLKELASAEQATTAGALFEWLYPAQAELGFALGFRPAEPPFVLLPQRQYPSNGAALAPAPMVRMALTALPPSPHGAPAQNGSGSASAVPSFPPQPASITRDQQTLFNWPPRISPEAEPAVQQAESEVRSDDVAADDADADPDSDRDFRESADEFDRSLHLRPPAPTQSPTEWTAAEANFRNAATPWAPDALGEAQELEPQELEPQELEPQELEPQELEPQELEPQELEPQELEPEVPSGAGTASSPAWNSESELAGAPQQLRASTVPPPAPHTLAEPQSWRPPGGAVAPRAAEDEAALLAAARAAVAAGDDEGALALAQRCLELFPGAVGALQIAAGQLARLERWHDLAHLYDQLIAGHPDRLAVSKLCVAASRLYATKLAAPERAVHAIERACELTPRNSELHLEAAGLYETLEQLQFAENHYRTALSVDPLNDRCYRRASAFFAWTGQLDAAWNAACVVSHLAPPDAAEELLLQTYSKETLPQPARSLQSGDFAAGLSASANDPTLSQLLSLAAETARLVQLPKAKQQELLLRQYQAEDPQKSTTTLARAFNWACRFFNIPAPELYFAEGTELPSLLPIGRPAWLVGKGVGRGLSAQELVFIWARALSRLRPEGRVTLCYPTTEQVQHLVAALLCLGGQLAPANPAVSSLVKALKKQADPSLLTALAERAASFDSRVAARRVQAFCAQLELASNRLGLLAAGNPQVAANCLARFPAGELPLDQQLSDLLSYSMSQPYGDLRRTLGIAVATA